METARNMPEHMSKMAGCAMSASSMPWNRDRMLGREFGCVYVWGLKQNQQQQVIFLGFLVRKGLIGKPCSFLG